MINVKIRGFIKVTINEFSQGSINVDASLFFDNEISSDFVLKALNSPMAPKTLISYKSVYLKSN